jgi:pyruvate/2-oxoglutarate dehydrogenase complex dihydrolipoamide dehydrogenase (E3) component
MIEYDIAVIGGGTAGRAAARAAVEAGARTALIDERDIPSELIAGVTNLAVLPRTVAWGLYSGFQIGIAPAEGQAMIAAKRVILATGSTEEVLAFPGSDLPGVMTARGLLRLLNEYHVWPGGKRVAIIGESQYADELSLTVEDLGGDLVHYADRSDVTVEATASDGMLSAVRIDGETYACDILALSLREVPDLALAAMRECELGYSQALGGFTPRRSERMETTVPGLYICGGIAGIGLPDEYQDEASIAALAAAQSLGFISGDEIEPAIEGFRFSYPERIEGVEAIERSWAQHHANRSIAAPVGER